MEIEMQATRITDIQTDGDGFKFTVEYPSFDVSGLLAEQKAAYLFARLAQEFPERMDALFLKNEDLDCLMERLIQIKGLKNVQESVKYYSENCA